MATRADKSTIKLEVSLLNDDTWATIPGAKNFDFGADSVEQLDATDFDSPAGRTEYISGNIDSAEGSFVYHVEQDKVVQEGLEAALGGAAVGLRMVRSTIAGDGTITTKTKTTTALIVGFSDPVDVNGIMEATVTIRRTGSMVTTAGAPT